MPLISLHVPAPSHATVSAAENPIERATICSRLLSRIKHAVSMGENPIHRINIVTPSLIRLLLSPKQVRVKPHGRADSVE